MYRNDLNDDYIGNRNPFYPGAEGIYRFPDYIPTITNLLDFVQDGLASLADSLSLGAIPAYRASRLRPVDALRYE